ncbi:hypothetical protein BLOT_011301 [Blomia tropicalis]|nr:hypothetical protein BLOT_011301 [Blomia tropicalis]
MLLTAKVRIFPISTIAFEVCNDDDDDDDPTRIRSNYGTQPTISSSKNYIPKTSEPNMIETSEPDRNVLSLNAILALMPT